MHTGRRLMNPRVAITVVAWVAALTALVVVLVNARDAPGGDGNRLRRTVIDGRVVRFDGAGPERWAQRWRREHRETMRLRLELRRQRRLVLSSPSVVEAVDLAAATYGNGQALWRKARCETGGTLNPSARNLSSGAAGIFQFLGSTWATTPYARFSVFSPYANALAAGWMHRVGRGGEWACR